MKKNEYNFDVPTRQSIFAILLIILKYFKVVGRQIWPLLILFVVNGQQNRRYYLFLLVCTIALLSMVWAIISYFKYHFHISGREIIVEKGILRKTKINIPFDRIQTVNYQQNLIHRVFNVVQLDIDTAGSEGSEFSFDALSIEKASAFKELVFSQKRAIKLNTIEQPSQVEANTDFEHTILHLNPIDLLKVGISQNHLRSVALIFAALFWILESIEDLGFGTEEMLQSAYKQGMQSSVLVLVLLFVVVVFISFIISLGRTVIRYFDLNLIRKNNLYNLVSGLITKREQNATDQKIQILQWNINLLQKLFKFYDVRLKQASSVRVSAKKSLHIPGCYKHHVEYIKTNWLGEMLNQPLVMRQVSKYYLIRMISVRMIVLLLIISACWIFKQGLIIWIPIVLIPYVILHSWLGFKKARFGLNEKVLFIGKGAFGESNAILPLYKIQNLSLTQSPYQSRRDLASLKVYTASGSVSIPYIHVKLAHELYDYLLYKVESNPNHWM